VDYSAQEHGVSGVLSGDEKLVEGYRSGDPYMSFAKSCGAVPSNATKQTHSEMRDAFKLCTLGILYGMKAKRLSIYSGQTLQIATEILESHKRVYKRFWQWTEEVLEKALLRGFIQTVYGWRFRSPWKSNKPDPKNRKGIPVRTIKNFPVQANAAEMFRLACSLMSERGVRVCAMVHDAVLVEAPLSEIDRAVWVTRKAMAEASRAVLKDRLELRTDAKIFTDHYVDGRGQVMWETVRRLLESQPEKRVEEIQLGLWS